MSSNVIHLSARQPASRPARARAGSPAAPASLSPFGLAMEGPAYLPGPHPPGSAGFRYQAVSRALNRTASFWHAHLQPACLWPTAPWLSVRQSQSTSESTAHEPGRLVIGGGAPPQAAARAMGSAILHLLRPDLWHLAGTDTGPFRRGFADAAVLLAMLHEAAEAEQRHQLRQHATTTFGVVMADVVECLAAHARSAARTASSPAARTARLLAQAIRRADLAADFAPQIAAEMALLAWQVEGERTGQALCELFARHWLLANGAVLEQMAAREHIGQRRHQPSTAWMVLDGGVIGCDRPVAVCAPAQLPRFAFERPPGAGAMAAPVQDMRAFLKVLDSLALIERPRPGTRRRLHTATEPATTAVLVKDGPVLRLRRLRFVSS